MATGCRGVDFGWFLVWKCPDLEVESTTTALLLTRASVYKAKLCSFVALMSTIDFSPLPFIPLPSIPPYFYPREKKKKYETNHPCVSELPIRHAVID